MGIQWKSYRRFAFWLLVLCAVVAGLVSALALWESYDIAELGVALAVAGILLTLLGLLPLLLLPGSFQRFGPWGAGAATSDQRMFMAIQEARILDPTEMIRQDLKDRDDSMPLTMLLLVSGVLCMLAGWGLQTVG